MYIWLKKMLRFKTLFYNLVIFNYNRSNKNVIITVIKKKVLTKQW